MHIARADASYLARLVTHVENGGLWTLHNMGIEPPTGGVLLEPAAPAFIGRGAWRVACPFCSGSQFGDPDHDRFCCCDCANNGLGWITVAYPADLKEIETALLRRSNPTTMNWLPHESVEHLWAENVERGVHDLADVPNRRRKIAKALVEAGQEVAPVHVIAPGTFVHPDSEFHPGKAIEWLQTTGHNYTEDDIRLALIVHGQGR